MDAPTAVLVRPAHAGDIPAIVAMVGRFLNETPYARWLRFEPDRIGQLTAAVIKNGAVFVSEQDGRLTGVLAAVLVEEPYSAQLIVEELVWWVNPEHRRGRAGLALLEAVEAYAREEGATLIKMVAPAGSRVGLHYIRRGYSAVEVAYAKPIA